MIRSLLLALAVAAPGGAGATPPRVEAPPAPRAPSAAPHPDPAALEAQIVEEIASFQHDPLGYVLFAFPWGQGELAARTGPNEWQTQVLTRIGDKLRAGAAVDAALREAILEAVVSGHGVGKSALVAWLVLWGLSTFEDSRALVTANTGVQLANKTWPELKKWHRLSINSHWFHYTATALYSVDAEHATTWRADCVPWSLERSEAFAGLHNAGRRLLVLFDEASAIPDPIWEVTEGALTDEGTEIIWCAFGNPTRASGRFRECFRRLKHRWGNTHVDARAVPGVNKVQLEKWITDHGLDSDFVKIRVRGIFPSQSPRQFIAESDVDAAYGRHLKPEAYEHAPKILTLDNAWTGEDEIVIGLRQGLLFRILWTAPYNDNDVDIASRLAWFEDEEEADAVFIDAGYGTGVASLGKTWSRKWQLVWFNGASGNPGCKNKRAEMWQAGKQWLKNGGAIPADEVLRLDLTGPETIPRDDGLIDIEAKDDMKARGLPSPGRGDALMLSFAFPVKHKDRNALGAVGGTRSKMTSTMRRSHTQPRRTEAWAQDHSLRSPRLHRPRWMRPRQSSRCSTSRRPIASSARRAGARGPSPSATRSSAASPIARLAQSR